MDKKSEDNEKILDCIFDGITMNNHNATDLIEKYQNFIKFLDNKKERLFQLKRDEIDKIITINENIWRFKECNVKAIMMIQKIYRYEISFVLENISNKGQIQIIKTFFKTMYKFNYKQISYICFTKESMKSKLNEINQHHDFYITESLNGEARTISQIFFLFLDIPEFTINISYKYLDIALQEIKFEDIYKIPEIITGNDLNKKLGLYTDFNEEDFKNFIYYETKERSYFLDSLTTLFGQKNYIGLCGPFGTGKTITLLKFLIKSSLNRVLYINLWTIENIPLEEIKKLLKYESIKLFGFNYFNPSESSMTSLGNEIFENIFQKIDNFNNKKNIFLLLEAIIKLIIKIKFYVTIYVVIDQYSSKYDEKNKSLKQLLKSMEYIQNVYIIVSSTMNNDDVKKYFSDSIEPKNLYSIEKNSDGLGLNYYYIGCLIRLNSLENYNTFLNNKTSKFIKYLNDLGNLPLYYYELKKKLTRNRKLEQYMENERDEIIFEINSFYNNNLRQSDSGKLQDILKILTIINKKEIYLIEELSEEILHLPLKFFEIKKEYISLNELKIFSIASNNQKFIEKFEKIEEDKEGSIINDIINFDKYLKNFMIFVNENNYCSNYIKFISPKKRKKILADKELYKGNQKIFIYYFDYLFPFMEEIFSNLIYNLVSSVSKSNFYYLPRQSQGGFLEYIINEYIKKTGNFMGVNVTNYQTIECLVPNSFYIQNYSSRIKETIKTYTENKNNSDLIKIDLNNENTFIQQNQITGKYYDCCLLIYKPKSKTYILYVFQISKKKISSNRYFREEHEIIFNRVKDNLEKRYSIKIDEGHFSYILLNEEKDENTINFCKENILKYYLFSIDKLCFSNEKILFDKESLITKDFPFQSSFSILSKETFGKDNKGKLINMKNIIEFEKTIKFIKISDKFKKIIEQYFILKNSEIHSEENEFSIVGNFENYFNVNHNFCFWIDNNELSIIYHGKNEKVVNIKLENFKRLSQFNFTLICSKFKIKCNQKNL